MRTLPQIHPTLIAFVGCLLLGDALATPLIADDTGEQCDVELWDTEQGLETMTIDEKCEYFVNLDNGPDQAWVGRSLSPEARRLVFSFWIRPVDLQLGGSDRVCVFELGTEAPGEDPLIAIDLVRGSLTLALRADWRSDNEVSGVLTPAPPILRSGAVVDVEWVRSTHPTAGDGAIRLYLDNQLVAQARGLTMEVDLPQEVRFGVVETGGSSVSGGLEFKPLQYTWQFHRNLPASFPGS